jgi:ketosteroid isomerase-like protein
MQLPLGKRAAHGIHNFLFSQKKYNNSTIQKGVLVMLRTVILFAAMSVLFIGCQKREDVTAITKAIDEMDKKFVESVNKMDADGAASIYWNSPNLVVYYPDTLVMYGHEALKTYWQTVFAMNDVKRFEFTDHHVVATQHMASDWGQWSFTLQPKGAPSEITFTGRYSQTWEQKDGKWVVTVDHASSPLPPPPPPVQTSDAGKDKKKK